MLWVICSINHHVYLLTVINIGFKLKHIIITIMNTKFIAAYEPRGTTPDLRLVNGSVRAIRSSELLIRVVATGICHTDLIFATWPADQIPYPKVLGHEGQFNFFLVLSAMITEVGV